MGLLLNYTYDKLVQFSNVPSSTNYIWFGIIIYYNPVQLAKEYYPKNNNDYGNMIDYILSLYFDKYIYIAITSIPSGIVNTPF